MKTPGHVGVPQLYIQHKIKSPFFVFNFNLKRALFSQEKDKGENESIEVL
jgi:hypothetical protein